MGQPRSPGRSDPRSRRKKKPTTRVARPNRAARRKAHSFFTPHCKQSRRRLPLRFEALEARVLLSVTPDIDKSLWLNQDDLLLPDDGFVEQSQYPTESMEEHRLGFEGDTSEYFTTDGYLPAGDATPTGESYILYEHWGGTWCDAEKVPPDSYSPPGTGDDFMCWAGAASNVLEWTGWGLVDGMADTDDIFQYFQDHWTDRGGLMEFGWDWWFDGTNDSQGWSGWSQVDVTGGGFYPSEDFSDYFHSRSGSSQALSTIDEYLHAGYGVTLGIYGPGGHAITCWGYNYDSGNPTDYFGVWVTDSDDSKSSSTPPDRLHYYEVEYVSEKWYLQDYYGSDAWYIDLVQALEPSESTPPPPPDEANEIHGTVWNDSNGNGVLDAGEAGLPAKTVYLDANNNGVWDQGGVSVASADVPKAIYDYATTTSTLTVGGTAGVISDVNVTLDITHSYDDDLEVYLYGPSGTVVRLFTEVGGWGDNFTNTTLDDEAPTAITQASAPFTGTFRPEGLLADFDGEDANGTWTLEITDNWWLDEGVLNSWSLEIAADEPAAETDAAGDYHFTNLDDGLYYVRHEVPQQWAQTFPENGYYQVDLQDGAVVEQIDFGDRTTVPTINFNDYAIRSYGGSVQDVTGPVTVEDAGATLHLTGNRWKAISLPYNLTANTVLEFDFTSARQGEVHGIGFDTDLAPSKDRTFQLYGGQSWGIDDFRDYAGTAPGSKHYQIPVGRFYTGQMDYLFFCNDHDVSNPTGQSVFSNVEVYEAESAPTVDFNGYTIRSYGGSSQDVTGPVTVEDAGATLHLTGNRWKAISLPYNLTANTVLEFDFTSTRQGEVHGIGFDTDLALSKDRTFQLYGGQSWGIDDFRDYAGTAPGPKHYQIPVGRFYTGQMDYLFFCNDHDVSNPTGQSVFSNVEVYEAESAPTVDFNGYTIRSYGGSSQDVTGPVTVEDAGATLHLTGNRWKAISLSYKLTTNTVLEFDFTSTRQGEVHGIGFDTDLALSKDRTFQLYGTQSWGIDDFRDYVGTAPGSEHYQIQVGQFYTGQMDYLFFCNDHDVSNPTGQSVFSNVEVYELNPGSSASKVESATGNTAGLGPASRDPGLVARQMAAFEWAAINRQELLPARWAVPAPALGPSSPAVLGPGRATVAAVDLFMGGLSDSPFASVLETHPEKHECEFGPTTRQMTPSVNDKGDNAAFGQTGDTPVFFGRAVDRAFEEALANHPVPTTIGRSQPTG